MVPTPKVRFGSGGTTPEMSLPPTLRIYCVADAKQSLPVPNCVHFRARTSQVLLAPPSRPFQMTDIRFALPRNAVHHPHRMDRAASDAERRPMDASSPNQNSKKRATKKQVPTQAWKRTLARNEESRQGTFVRVQCKAHRGWPSLAVSATSSPD